MMSKWTDDGDGGLTMRVLHEANGATILRAYVNPDFSGDGSSFDWHVYGWDDQTPLESGHKDTEDDAKLAAEQAVVSVFESKAGQVGGALRRYGACARCGHEFSTSRLCRKCV